MASTWPPSTGKTNGNLGLIAGADHGHVLVLATAALRQSRQRRPDRAGKARRGRGLRTARRLIAAPSIYRAEVEPLQCRHRWKCPATSSKKSTARPAREYPHECCGWLAGDRDGHLGNHRQGLRQHAGRRAATRQPPARTAETAYVFGAQDLLELNHSLDSDRPARIIYHSHPNGQAYLSDIDRGVAISPWGDGPAYPVQQLVIGIDAHRIVDAALYDWSDEASDFIEIARFDGVEV